MAARDAQRTRSIEMADFGIHPNPSLKPLVLPLDFSVRNMEYMIQQGYSLMDKSMLRFKEKLTKKY